MKLWALAAIASGAAISSCGAAPHPVEPRPVIETVRARIHGVPRLVHFENDVALFYEIIVENDRSDPLDFVSLETAFGSGLRVDATELRAGARRLPVGTIRSLEELRQIRDELANPFAGRVPPQGAVVEFFHLLAPRSSGMPQSIGHVLTLRDEGGQHYPLLLTLDHPSEPIRVLGSPLRGSWICANGPSNTSNHRQSMLRIGDHNFLAQRFAIDFLGIDDDGRAVLSTDPSPPNDAFVGYGREVLAVADATVTDVRDGIPENADGPESRAVPMTLDTLGGNFVILELDEGAYAFYAHLQPGTIRVRRGDHVDRAMVLGLVGNSGNSTAPHLHFHVCDAPSPLECEGLPYAFERYVRRDYEPPADESDPSAPLRLSTTTHDVANALPQLDGLVTFN